MGHYFLNIQYIDVSRVSDPSQLHPHLNPGSGPQEKKTRIRILPKKTGSGPYLFLSQYLI